MTPERWERIKTILGDALEVPAGEREDFVKNAAADDPGLVEELLRLLAENERDSVFGTRPGPMPHRPAEGGDEPCLPEGACVARRFRVIRFIARGGMGEVYEAEDLELGGRVALKTIRRHLAPESEALAMFRREVQLARQITHPNVCRIFDLVQDQDEQTGETTAYVSMEFVKGRTLSEFLQEQGPMAARDALPLIQEIAAGLQAVHDAGIVHGDLKPGNVILAERPGEARQRPIVMDFGLASPVGDNSSVGSPVRGRTPEYSAPEQASGAPLSTATDVYCLALIIEDILGVPRSERLQPSAARMPAGWARALKRSLNADPAKRFDRPVDLCAALRRSVGSGRRAALLVAAIAALALAAFLVSRLPGPRQDSNQNLNRLWWEPPQEYSTNTVSPGGRYLLAVDLFRHRIVLHDLATGKDRFLSDPPRATDDSERVVSPVISPDEKTVAYAWSTPKDFELRTVKADGTGTRVLSTQRLTPAAWSADGREILGTLGQPSSTIAAIRVSDGAFRVVKQFPEGRVGNIASSFDGKYLSYVRRAPKGWKSFILAPGGEFEFPSAWGMLSVVPPVWTPDGFRVVFASDRGSSPGLWTGRVTDGKPVGDPEELKADFKNAGVLGFTRRGSLFYRLSKPTSDIFLANLDPATGKLTSGPTRVNYRGVGSAWGRVAWLPDGKSLSFWEQRQDRAYLVVYSLATGEESDLWDHSTAPDVGPGYAGWFPDGHSIMSWEDKGQSRIATRLDSKTLKPLASWTTRENSRLSVVSGWGISPDLLTWFLPRKDESIACAQGSCTYLIIARSLETGKDREILRTNQLVPGSPVASTSGRQVAIPALDNRTKEHLLLILAVAGGEPREIYRGNDALEGVLAWTADDQHVLAYKNEPGRGELWAFPAGGGPPEKSEFGMPILGGAVNPLGDRIAIVGSGPTKREIWEITGRHSGAQGQEPTRK